MCEPTGSDWATTIIPADMDHIRYLHTVPPPAPDASVLAAARDVLRHLSSIGYITPDPVTTTQPPPTTTQPPPTTTTTTRPPPPPETTNYLRIAYAQENGAGDPPPIPTFFWHFFVGTTDEPLNVCRPVTRNTTPAPPNSFGNPPVPGPFRGLDIQGRDCRYALRPEDWDDDDGPPSQLICTFGDWEEAVGCREMGPRIEICQPEGSSASTWLSFQVECLFTHDFTNDMRSARRGIDYTKYISTPVKWVDEGGGFVPPPEAAPAA